jgi:hypothetical protein
LKEFEQGTGWCLDACQTGNWVRLVILRTSD